VGSDVGSYGNFGGSAGKGVGFEGTVEEKLDVFGDNLEAHFDMLEALDGSYVESSPAAAG
jgi:hypothetical protein